MSDFYRRNVQDQSGAIFSNAILGALQARRQRQRQDKLDAEHDQDRSRAQALQNYQLGEQGVTLLGKNEVPYDALRTIGSNLTAGVGPTGATVTESRPASYSFGPGYVVNEDQRRANEERSLNQTLAVALGRARATEAARAGSPLGQATIAHLNAQTSSLLNPKPSAPHTVNASTGIFSVGPNGTTTPLTGPDGRPLMPHEAPQRPLTPSFTFTTGLGPDGKPVIVAGNTRTGTVQATPIGKPAPLGSTRGTIDQTRLATAAGQASDADKVMSAFEDQVIGGKAHFSTMDAYLARKVLGGKAGDAVAVAAENQLKQSNPGLFNYLMAAKQMATAERLITPRGGSNALMYAEQILSSAGLNPDASRIDQARNFRRRLSEGLSQHTGAPTTPQPTVTPNDTRQGKEVMLNGKKYIIPE